LNPDQTVGLKLFLPLSQKKLVKEINLAPKAAIAFSFLALLSGIMLSSALAAGSMKIGILLPLKGYQAPFGRIQQNAVQMAAAEVNAGGGLNGKKIELAIADTQGNPDAGRAAILKLIQHDKVIVIGGGISNAATWATIPIAQKNKIPFLVNSASADKITEQGWEYIFRLNQPQSERLDAVASFLAGVASDIRSVAIVHATSFEQAAAARQFSQKADMLGLKQVFREGFATGSDDFRPLLTRLKAANPDLIYAVTDHAEDAALLARQLKELELNPKLFIGAGDGFIAPEFVLHAAKASDHILCMARWTPRLPYHGAATFNEKFIARYKTPPGHYGAEAYAGMAVMAEALLRSKVLTPQNVRVALAKTRAMTVLGPVEFVSYNNKSQQNKLPAFLVQWLNGQAEIVWPKQLATQKVVYPVPH